MPLSATLPLVAARHRIYTPAHPIDSAVGASIAIHKEISMKTSILRNLLYAFLALGMAMGLIFPVYAQFFVE